MYKWVMAGIAATLFLFGASELLSWRRSHKATDVLAALTWMLMAACFVTNTFSAPRFLLPLLLLALAAAIGASLYLRIRNDPTT